MHLPKPGPLSLSIDGLILAYRRFAKSCYVKNGRPTDRLYHIRLAMCPLRKLHGHTPAHEFGPRKLKAVREEMVAEGLAKGRGLNRGHINDHTGIIKRVFRCADAYCLSRWHCGSPLFGIE